MNDETLFFPVTLLIIISFIDWATYQIPDLLVLSLVGYRLTQPFSVSHLISLFVTIIVCVSIQKIASTRIKRQVIGGGDIKLILWCSSFLHPEQLGTFFFLSGIFGILCHVLRYGVKRGDYFPFAPALSMGFLLSLKKPEILQILYQLL
jgi:prepilin signal peptidase PulO-like enzyme (type II secretory pathway)